MASNALRANGLTANQELSRITDQRVEFSLRSADASAGKWLQEDPPLSTVQRMIESS